MLAAQLYLQQFREILKDEALELVIDPEVSGRSPKWRSNTKWAPQPARDFEEMLMPVLYQVPDRPDAKKVVINRYSKNWPVTG